MHIAASRQSEISSLRDENTARHCIEIWSQHGSQAATEERATSEACCVTSVDSGVPPTELHVPLAKNYRTRQLAGGLGSQGSDYGSHSYAYDSD